MTNPNRIYLSAPHLNGTEIQYVKKAFASNWIAPVGPDLSAFEQEVCNYTGAKYAAALSSGTAALHLALKIAGVSEGDDVLCSTFTFAGSVFPIMYLGAAPVFVDSDLLTWNMDPLLLEQAIQDKARKGKKPKAAVIVHLYGQSANMDALLAICNKYEVAVVEDAAESMGAYYRGKHTGTIAPLGVFSFNGNKIITTSGGGMLVGQDKDNIDIARYYSTQSRKPAAHYEHEEIGYNYRMSNIVAAIGRGQLITLEERVKRKREIFDYYYEKLGQVSGVSFMPEADYGRANRWLSCLTIDPEFSGCTREDVRLALECENIESRPLWKPMHLQPVFRKYSVYLNGVSEKLFKTGLCLPSGTSLSSDQLERITRCIMTAIKV
ncbi:MAG: pyridoxal phosphate-dependent aminotransferase [Chitinivibrionales bacterium]|nr:pyridoxal phosphate-dependent aminotransferase [Chitinivibrionales bacterium]